MKNTHPSKQKQKFPVNNYIAEEFINEAPTTKNNENKATGKKRTRTEEFRKLIVAQFINAERHILQFPLRVGI